jgi:hypothetical protein
MPDVSEGVLVSADPAAIAYLIHLDQKEQFIIDKDLDETHLLVLKHKVEFINKKLEELADKNHFQPETR